jgi:hypothetical protein
LPGAGAAAAAAAWLKVAYCADTLSAVTTAWPGRLLQAPAGDASKSSSKHEAVAREQWCCCAFGQFDGYQCFLMLLMRREARSSSSEPTDRQHGVHEANATRTCHPIGRLQQKPSLQRHPWHC